VTDPAAVPVVGRVAELAATVREALAFCYRGKLPQALAALSELAALAARVPVLLERLEVERADHEVWAEAEEQRDAYRVQSEAQASEALKWRKRAVAAEAENTRLRAALEQIETTTYALNETLEAIVAMKGIARDALAAATTPNPQDT
jgi:molecular chaperone GrpE (heat shock protein)